MKPKLILPERLDFKFRCQPRATSSDGLLVGYLQGQLPAVRSAMILKALRAYWLAEAYQACDKKRGQELKRLAQQMISLLEDQITCIRIAFGLDIPTATSLQTSVGVSVSSAQLVNHEPSEESKSEPNEDKEDGEPFSFPIFDMDSI